MDTDIGTGGAAKGGDWNTDSTTATNGNMSFASGDARDDFGGAAEFGGDDDPKGGACNNCGEGKCSVSGG
jgi:hypothetical protein